MITAVGDVRGQRVVNAAIIAHIENGTIIILDRDNRNARNMEPDSVMLNSERAVLDTELCYGVGEFFAARGREAGEDSLAEALAKIALCKQRIENAEKLFMMARIDEATRNRAVSTSMRSFQVPRGQSLRLAGRASAL